MRVRSCAAPLLGMTGYQGRMMVLGLVLALALLDGRVKRLT